MLIDFALKVVMRTLLLLLLRRLLPTDFWPITKSGVETGFRFRFSYRYCNFSYSYSLCVGLRSQHVVSVYVLLHFVLYALLVILCLSFVLTFVLFCFVLFRFDSSRLYFGLLCRQLVGCVICCPLALECLF